MSLTAIRDALLAIAILAYVVLIILNIWELRESTRHLAGVLPSGATNTAATGD